jgi:cellobiose transport system substrate-binding protein
MSRFPIRYARLRPLAAALAGVALLAGSAACAGDETAQNDGRLTLTVDTFGNFGYKALLREYQAAHPELRVVERVLEYNEHHEQLKQRLDDGTGAGDVVGIDEGYAVQFRDRQKDFANLLDFGAGGLAKNWLAWKWDATLSADRTYQIGLGTDVGGLAMCYRPDLFRAAGLPTDRDAVAKMWPTWKAYIDAGRKFKAAELPAQWTDAASNIYNQILAQQPAAYFDRQEKLIINDTPAVRHAWDLTVEMVQAGESAKYIPFNPQWRAALQGGRFATLTCPAWVLGWIQQNAPAARGQWDVATVPGGAGNWGGSWLAVPAQSKHHAEAYALAAWLTAPAQQLRVFTDTGNLPSAPQLYDDAAVTAYRNPFFRDAPVGQIFASSVRSKPAQYLGRHNAAVRKVFEDRLSQVEVGALPADKAWTDAVAEAHRIGG